MTGFDHGGGGAPWERVNSKLLRAHVSGGSLLSRRGAMIAYIGDVRFEPRMSMSGGMGGFVGRMIAGEQVPMMEASGSGSILYGYRGMQVTLMELQGDQVTVEADRLLAFPTHMQAGTVMLGGGSGGGGGGGGLMGALRGAARSVATGQGLATTVVSGSGPVAVLSHGPVFELQVRPGGPPVAVDPQAYVAHRGPLDVAFRSSAGFRDVVGRGSGEAFQLQCQGQGTVFVQASEEKIG